MIIAAHPAAAFGDDTAALLSEIAGTEARCVDVTNATSFDAMIDGLEDARRQAGIERWLFWGMSGGGWLAQLYAHRHPEALTGIIVESACACFRERLRDPACAISPLFPAWRDAPERVADVVHGPDGELLVASPAPIDDLMKKQMPLLLTFDARPWLADVRVPALVIAGGADPIVPVARVRAVHEAIRGSSFVEVEGGGHVPSTSHARAAVQAVRAFVRASSS
jgi:3-oxoadipate enol-lactonase